jgi:hypothetical protein
MSSNPVHVDIYSIQHYVIEFVIYLRSTGPWLSPDPGTPVYYTNKTDLHDITEILLKKALNTINQSYKIATITKN